VKTRVDVRTKEKPNSLDVGAGAKLFTPEEVAAYLGIGRTYAYALLRAGLIPSLKIGKLRRIRQADVDLFIEKRLSEETRQTT